MGDDLAERVEVGATVGVHDALGSPGGPRGVVDGDDRVLVVDGPGHRLRRRELEGLLERFGLRPEAGRVRLGAVGIGGDQDQLQLLGHLVAQSRQQVRVRDEHPDSGMLDDVRDLRGREPGVERDHGTPGQWDSELREQRLGRVRCENADPVTARDATHLQQRGQSRGPFGEFGVGLPPWAVDHRDLVGRHPGRFLEESQRAQCGVQSRYGSHRECVASRVGGRDVRHGSGGWCGVRSDRRGFPPPLPGRRNRREAGIEVGVLVGIGAAIGASTEAGAPGRTSVMR